MGAKKENRTLSKPLQGKYEMVGVLPGKIMYGPNRQTIDTRTCTLKQAAAAVKAGSKLIKKVEPKKGTKSSSSSK